MKNWQKKIGLLAVASCVTVMMGGSALAVSKSAGAGEHRSAVQQKAIQWLTVLVAKKAKLSHIGNGLYRLSVSQSDLSRVIGISDRPVRDVRDISGYDLGKLFNTSGKNSFKKDPPNAVLIYNGTKGMAVEILSSKKSGGMGEFILKPLKSYAHVKTGRISGVVLAIDNEAGTGSSNVGSTSLVTTDEGTYFCVSFNKKTGKCKGKEEDPSDCALGLMC